MRVRRAFAVAHAIATLLALGADTRIFQSMSAIDILKKVITGGGCDADALVQLCRAVIDGLMVQRVMTKVALAPIHELFWTNVLLPLKRDPEDDCRTTPRRRAEPRS